MNGFIPSVAIAFTILCFFTANLQAMIVIGDLTYDDAKEYIEHSDGTKYLNLRAAKDLTYAETEVATQEGGAFAGYHIASQAEAYKLYNAFSFGSDAVDTVGLQFFKQTIFEFADGFFGDNRDEYSDLAWFLSDESDYVVGLFALFNVVDEVHIYDAYYRETTFSDQWSASGYYRDQAITWLLVGDSTQVPTPTSFALVVLGLFCLGAARRKKLKR